MRRTARRGERTTERVDEVQRQAARLTPAEARRQLDADLAELAMLARALEDVYQEGVMPVVVRRYLDAVRGAARRQWGRAGASGDWRDWLMTEAARRRGDEGS